MCTLRTNLVKNCRKCQSSYRSQCGLRRRTPIKTFFDSKERKSTWSSWQTLRWKTRGIGIGVNMSILRTRGNVKSVAMKSSPTLLERLLRRVLEGLCLQTCDQNRNESSPLRVWVSDGAGREPRLGGNSSCVKGRCLNCSSRNHTCRTQIVVLPFRPWTWLNTISYPYVH